MPMTSEHKLDIDIDEARAIARSCFGVDLPAVQMDGFEDFSFRLGNADQEGYVLKISSPARSRATLEMQDALLEHLQRKTTTVNVPRPVRSRKGQGIETWTSPAGDKLAVRLLRFVPGTFACDRDAADAHLLRSIGRGLAALNGALREFDHPGAHRSHEWDLSRAATIVPDMPLDEPARSLVEASLAAFRERVVPRLPELRKSVIHADVNDHNLLVADVAGRGASFSGLIDFGDALYAPTIFELAIALAYFMMNQARPLLAAQELIASYHARLPLEETELAILFDLVRARLAMSLCHSARARRDAPDNAYLTRSEAAAQELLEKLSAVQRDFAHYVFRDACRLQPWPGQQQLECWLAEQSCAPVVEGLAAGNFKIFDFTPGSDDLDGQIAPKNLHSFNQWVERSLTDAGASFGIGRYAEIRGLYQSEVFSADSNQEARTVHLGVDIFAPAGTPVYAPLAGTVHSLADNDLPLDYGPTIILQHETNLPGGGFYTLYGHLSRESLDGLVPGANIRQGQLLAHMGEDNVNGGWPPHLHFQITGDLLGKAGDFPGVGRHSDINVWKSLCPNPARFFGLAAGQLDANCGASPVELARRRAACLSPSLSLAFSEPVKIVRARGATLYTEQGARILDLVNNVAHVGHAHPTVVAAIQRQEAALNTNTRYLHDGLVSYAERLTALLPAELDTCFLVCTGSEANDLALRLARSHTGGTDVVVVDGAYHGSLGALVELSPYKFSGRGGKGRAEHVQVAAMPDPYDGEFSGQPDAGPLYARSVGMALDRIHSSGRRPAAFFCESALGCAGQIILPEGYLGAAYKLARAAGALCVADEVQVGFGRLGEFMWAFAHQQVVPDILTLGKPIGNGYPMAAVVTRREIAESFANGMEYFNTFGGNPVACAAGHAVLDVIQDQALLQHATRLGAQWLGNLQALAERHPIVGQVRGRGLFIGLELVTDRSSRAPAQVQARQVVEFLKEQGIQISIDGPRYNVLKIKPPMVITEAQTQRVVAALDSAFANLAR